MHHAWKRMIATGVIVAGVTFMVYSWSPMANSQQTDSAAAHRLQADSLVSSQQKDPAVALYRTRTEPPPAVKCPDLHYSHETLPITALASFPGSGNTWLRHLIQQSTGIYTGSVYNDGSLRRNGFPGEVCSNGSVVVVKTHRGPGLQFMRAILIIRDPYAALLSEFNRCRGNHTSQISGSVLETGEKWTNFVEKLTPKWPMFYQRWLAFKGPLHVVFYEDVKADLRTELTAILDFLGYPTTYLNCALKNSDGNFHRKKPETTEEIYDKTMREKIDKVKDEIYPIALKPIGRR